VGLLLTTVLLAATVAACGSSEPDSAGPEEVEEAASSPPPTPSASQPQARDSASKGDRTTRSVPEVLDFEATTVDGDAFEGASAAGKPVVLWFWAPWCPVCRSQVPMVTGLSDEYGEELVVLGVGSLDSEEAIAEFAGDAVGVTHLSDPDGALWKRFGIVEQSSFVVLDADGEEVLRTGYDNDGAVEDAVADATS
jgi:thiol-disulfide isomerase/thioredoxin